MTGSTGTRLVQLFATAGNQLHPTAAGFKTGHEPVHRSESGQCVAIDAQRETWYCHSCQQGGGILQALMSLRGLSHDEAEAGLKDLTGDNLEKRPQTKVSQATELVKLAAAAELWHTPEQEAWASIPVNGHAEHHPLKTKGFRRWLARQFHTQHGKTPGSQAVQDALLALEGQALFDGPAHPIFTRVAEHQGVMYLDLANEAWEAIEITPTGWRVVAQPPVRFRRAKGMLPLPHPVAGGTLEELRPYLNVTDEDWVLVKAWLAMALSPTGPYPQLELHGEQGSAKSTTARVLRALVDPSTAPMRSMPRDERDLLIMATNSWLIALDNLSYVPDWLSDALCRLATGGGLSTRELYTDADEVLFDVQRPCLINGIEDLAVRGDLLDRTIPIALPPIPDSARRDEKAFWHDFAVIQPRVLGALLNAASGALRTAPDVHVSRLPRMADFARWAIAAGPSLGYTADIFLKAYAGKREEVHQLALESSLIGRLITAMVAHDTWEGTAKELLDRLGQVAEDTDRKSKAWPKNARSLSNALRRIAPHLRACGYTITFDRTPDRKRTRMIQLTWIGNFASDTSDVSEGLPVQAMAGQLVTSAGASEADQDASDRRANSLGSETSDTNGRLLDATPSTHRPVASDDMPLKGQGVLDLPDAQDASDAKFPLNSNIVVDSTTRAEREGIRAGANIDDPGLSRLEFPLTLTNNGVDVDDISHHAVSVVPTFEPPALEYITQPSRLGAILPQLLEAPVLALDIETSGLDPLTDSLRTVQVATPRYTLIVDAHTCPPQMLAPVFTTVPRVIGHNLKFDLKFLVAAGLPWPTGQVCDTMLAAQLLGAGTPEGTLRQCGLAAVVERYLHVILEKAEQRSDWTGPLSPRQLRYAAIDAAVLLPLADRLEDALRSAGLGRVAALEGACVPALAWLELAGVPVHEAHWRDRAASERHRMAALQATLDALVGQPSGNGGGLTLTAEPFVNWQSPSQVLALLHSRGYAIEHTDSATLLAFANGDPLIAQLLDYRDAAKRAGTYGETWLDDHLHPVTGRIHADYLQLGSTAGRMSCARPNVQNLPRSVAYRGAIRAREGHVLVKADFSQIELRLAAAMAPDEAMLTAFRAGKDLHVLTASQVLRIPEDQVEKDQRQLAKALNFGLIYGMGAQRLEEHAWTTYRVRMREDEAIRHRQRFFQTYRGVQQWHRQTAARLKRERALETRTLAGRRRLAVAKFTEALNTPVQGTGADGLKLALARLFTARHEAPNTRLIAVVHDEILAECPEADAEATAEWLARHMTAAMQELVGDVVPITVDVTHGPSWSG